ncbi:MAG: hypothetical protein M3131_00200 [Actinomycetota bacterium]|nr:hypothetical protein [Actinomycetota bacterium]
MAGLLLGALALAPSRSVAATPATEYEAVPVVAPDQEIRARFGRLKVAGDIDRDGQNDLFTSAQNLDVGGVTDAGRVYALSGRGRQVLYKIDPPEPQEGAAFGVFLSAVGDLNGDGTSELAVGADSHDVGTGCGTPEPNGCNENQGKVWVFSGRAGNLLFALDNPAPQGSTTNQARFGQLIGSAGDITGDSRPEIIVGAPRNDQPAGCGSAQPLPAGCRVDEGQAFIFNGANGSLVRTLNFPPEDRYPADGGICTGSCAWFGGSVQGPGDVNGDGTTDQLVGAHSAAYYTGSGPPCGAPEPNGCNELQGRLYLFSGATGVLVRKIENPFPQRGTFFGFQDVAPLSPGDVTHDGRADLYGMVSQEGQFQGEGFVFNGATGGLLYPLRMPDAEVGSSLFAMTRTDYNRDGTPDLFAGDISSGTAPVDQNGGGYVFDGRNGSLLKALRLPEPDRQAGVSGNYGPGLGWNVGAPGDLNSDGEPDYVAGALAFDEGPTIDAGRIYFFLSRVPPRPPAPPNPLPVNPAAPFADCPSSTANVISGSSASERINGTPRADRIFAGTGNDVVDGLAADDCIDLGPGTDRGQGGDGHDLILGGLGSDRMSGNRGNDRLRGGSSGDRLIGGFGSDRLHGQSGADRISGERGLDRINGGSSGDVISAGSSGDRVAGDQGNDRINGNSGADLLKGNSGHDRITGSTGTDRIAGGSGNDRVNSRDGRRDRVNCGRGRDRVSADRFDVVARNCERVRGR